MCLLNELSKNIYTKRSRKSEQRKNRPKQQQQLSDEISDNEKRSNLSWEECFLFLFLSVRSCLKSKRKEYFKTHLMKFCKYLLT